VVAEASTGAQALEAYRRHLPDVALMDLRLPDFNGIEATLRLCREFPGAKVIIVSSYDALEQVNAAFAAGARGYLLKDVSADELAQAIRAAHAGRSTLSPEAAQALVHATSQPPAPGIDLTERELEVLKLVTLGQRNREIAAELGISENTVKFHLKNIVEKLHAQNRAELAARAVREGLVPDLPRTSTAQERWQREVPLRRR